LIYLNGVVDIRFVRQGAGTTSLALFGVRVGTVGHVQRSPAPSRVIAKPPRGFGTSHFRSKTINPILMLAADVRRRQESVDVTLAMLGRSRDLFASEDRWCQRAFAHSWCGFPVPRQLAVARCCASEATLRAGRGLPLPRQDAWFAGRWQMARPNEDRKDDWAWTHADVISAFDAAFVAIWHVTGRRCSPPTDGSLQ
jgi:hypothetical protein